MSLASPAAPRQDLASIARDYDPHDACWPCKHRVKSAPFNGFLAGKPLLGLWRGNALHELEQDALADAAIGDAQPANRPSGADRIEDGAAAQHQVGTLA